MKSLCRRLCAAWQIPDRAFYIVFCRFQFLGVGKAVYVLHCQDKASMAVQQAGTACLFGSPAAKKDNNAYAELLYAGPEQVGTNVERDAAIAAFFGESDWPEGAASLWQVHKGQKLLQVFASFRAGIAREVIAQICVGPANAAGLCPGKQFLPVFRPGNIVCNRLRGIRACTGLCLSLALSLGPDLYRPGVLP